MISGYPVISYILHPPGILHPLCCLLSWTLTTQKRVGGSLCLSWRQGFTWSWRRLSGWRFLQESRVWWVKYVMNECKLSEIVGELVRQERGDLAFSVAFDVRTDDPGTVISKQSFRRQTANFRRRNNCSKPLGCNIHFASFKKKSVSTFFTTETSKENELCPNLVQVINKTGTFCSSFHLCYQLFKGAAKVLFSKLESGPNIILAKGQIHRE